jgi:hypothetical protein
MISTSKLSVILAVLFLLLLPIFISRVSASNEETAALAITQAEGTMASAYKVVLEAEKAGANVTNLLSVLNEAGMLLSRAHLAYDMGDFDSAQDFAIWCKGNLTGFVGDADALKQSAVRERYWDFTVNVVGSAVGTVAVVVGGFVAWTFLKKKYARVGGDA